MKHLYFVRHGLSVMNVQGIWSGQTDTPLTDKGQQQATAAGQQLRGAGIDCIVASPQQRAKHTAELIAQQLDIPLDQITFVDALQERDFGPLEGSTYVANSDLDNTDGVEHSDDLIRRVAEGLDYIRGLDADTVLVVSHGAVGRALQSLLEPETTFHTSRKFANAEVVQLL